MIEVNLDRVCHQHEHFLALVEQKHQTKVAHALGVGILRLLGNILHGTLGHGGRYVHMKDIFGEVVNHCMSKLTFSGKPLPAINLIVSIWPKCVGYPNICMNISFATLRCLYSWLASPSLKASRNAALSFAIASRSSAAVLQLLTARISSLRHSKVSQAFG